MDHDELSELNKDFAEQTKQMFEEFVAIFEKWKKRSKRL